MKILLTGFEPFEKDKVNPSELAVKGLKKAPKKVELKKLILPTSFSKAEKRLLKEIKSFKPDAILSVGLAGGRCAVSVERVALNVMDARIKDNDGKKPEDTPVFKDGDTAYFATIPVKKIVAALKKGGIPAEVSNTAGLFVCNSVMYTALYYAAVKQKKMKAGFIHLPYLPEQAARLKKPEPCMSLDDDIRALEIALKVIAKE